MTDFLSGYIFLNLTQEGDLLRATANVKYGRRLLEAIEESKIRNGLLPSEDLLDLCVELRVRSNLSHRNQHQTPKAGFHGPHSQQNFSRDLHISCNDTIIDKRARLFANLR